MTTAVLTPPQAPAPDTRRGPLARSVVASLTVGAAGAAVLVLGVAPGATEAVTTGLALLALAAGWALLGLLASRRTTRPQRWAYWLAAFSAMSGAALVALRPDHDALTALSWVWPPALLVLVGWSARQLRASDAGRSRWLLYPVLGALALSSVGTLAQSVLAQREASAAPGRLVDVGGYRLHLQCTGTGSPTVVLENGLAQTSPLWARVLDGVAPATRVCAYDRAGTGWSDDAPGPRDGASVVRDLHRLLGAAGETGPFVLVGHSTGGAYALTYAAQHPDEVAGVVLLDSASPRQFTVLPDYAAQYPMMQRLSGVLPSLLRLGAGRVAPVLSANDVPGEAGRQASAFALDPRTARGARDELATYRRTFAQAQELTSLGGTPLVVLTASETLAGTAGWDAAQRELAGLSRNADARVVESTHGGLLDDPTASTASVTAVLDVVQAARTAGAVPQR